MYRKLRSIPKETEPVGGLSLCEHRTVSKDGRIICAKIVEGENGISPNLCRRCPFKAVNCTHLRFSLRQTTPSPLVVRHNGRTEIWDDDPPEVRFEQAACTAKVVPIDDARACAHCSLRQPITVTGQAPVRELRPRAAAGAKVVPFPSREALVAAG